MAIIESILKVFGFYCDPAAAIPVPTYKKTTNRGVSIPDNISFDSVGKPFQTNHREDGFDSEVVTIGRTDKRTPGDDWVMSIPPPDNKPKLKPDKYFKLKVFWAKGLSAKDTAKTLSGERGYKERTCDYYWTAFSKAQEYDIKRGVVETTTPAKSKH